MTEWINCAGTQSSAGFRAKASSMLAGTPRDCGAATGAADSASTARASTGVGATRCSVTGFECTTMLRTSFPDRVSGRTTLVICGVVSGEAAPAARAITATISVEQKRTEMFFIFPLGNPPDLGSATQAQCYHFPVARSGYE